MKILAQVSLVALLSLAGCRCENPTFTDPTILVSSADAVSGRFIVTLTPGGASVTRSLTVTNTGTCDFAYTAAVEDSWLSVSPATGTVPAGGMVTVTITVASHDPAGNNLALGTFLGTLTISGTCTETGVAPGGSPVSVLVQVTIANPDGGVVGDSGVTDAGDTTDAGGSTTDAGVTDAGG